MLNHRSLLEIAAQVRDLIRSCDVPSPGAPNRTQGAEFERLALELFGAQFENNPVYRALCHARGASFASVNTWTAIPALPAAGFKEFSVTCLAESERVAEFHSSGTTRQARSRHFHSSASLELYELSLWTWFRRHLLPDPTLRVPPELVVLTPQPQQAPHSSLVHMFETVRQRLGASPSVFLGSATPDGWTLHCGIVLRHLSALAQPAPTSQAPSRPVLLLGTALGLLQFMEFMASNKETLRLPPGSRVMETGGYKGRARAVSREQLHALCHRHLGVPLPFIIAEYGMSELSSQAYTFFRGPVRVAITHKRETVPASSSPQGFSTQSSDGRHATRPVFQFPPWARARIISPETGMEVSEGETGLIQVFDLANVFSVMAIQTEDVGVKRGSGFELLGRAAGAEPKGCSMHNVAV